MINIDIESMDEEEFEEYLEKFKDLIGPLLEEIKKQKVFDKEAQEDLNEIMGEKR